MGVHIAVSRSVSAPIAQVFAFLAVLENHWRLSPCFEVVSLDQDEHGVAVGGLVRVHGPLGVRCTVRTCVATMDPPSRIRGQASFQRTRAQVTWQLEPAGDATTAVRLSLVLERASGRDRLLFALGGRVWLRRQFAAILQQLDGQVAQGSAERWPGR